MGIDFGAFPPEINSARIYSGSGSGSLVSAASAWSALASELSSIAGQYDTVVTALSSDEWTGPSATAMASAAQPYVTWLQSTAAQASTAATQAMSAAQAFETVFASVVPPPAIAANRATLAQAVSTNLMGQNNSVIAQLEAQYGEFWAQDASAMYSYAGASSAATKLESFTAAPETTNGGLTSAATSAATSWTGNLVTNLNAIIAKLPKSLQNLAQPFQQAITPTLSTQTPEMALVQLLFGTTVAPSTLFSLVTDYSPYASLFYNSEGLPYFSIGMGNFFTQIGKALGGAAPAAAGHAASGAAAGLRGLETSLGGGAASAGLGNASLVGKLSVPESWAGATPVASHVAAPLQLSSVHVEGGQGASGAGNLVGGMPVAGTGAGSRGGFGPKYGFRSTVMARPPSAG